MNGFGTPVCEKKSEENCTVFRVRGSNYRRHIVLRLPLCLFVSFYTGRQSLTLSLTFDLHEVECLYWYAYSVGQELSDDVKVDDQ